GRDEEAVAHFERAISVRPGYAEAHYNLGNTLRNLDRPDAAVIQFQRAIAAQPGHVKAHINLGIVFMEQHRYGAALSACRRTLTLDPNYPEAHNNMGYVLQELGRPQEAVASFDRAIALYEKVPALKSRLGDVYFNRGVVLRALARFDEAIVSYRRAFEADPMQPSAVAAYVGCRRSICDWREFTADQKLVTRAVEAAALALWIGPDDAAVQLRGARRFASNLRIDAKPALPARGRGTTGKIRLGYLSSDFRDHANAYLMAELIELHDRTRFEVMAFAWGHDDGGPTRKRLRKTFDRFVDVNEMSDLALARQIRELGIDIAIDVNGYGPDCRPRALAYRPAPLQVNYVGYPATMGAEFIDYIIADPFVVPTDRQPFFVEKLVHLPDCYQPNVRKRPIASRTPSRAECGLPDQGFVFACFNNSYKITPEFFDIWMRLVQKTPGSVLWLLQDNNKAPVNLRQEAQARGVAPERLVFAARLPQPEHLARHRLADLFLDTLPYNAHATASDALWTGLPLLTCAGDGFAARVAGSCLKAAGLPELVTETLADYETLAERLAAEPERLREIRSKLERNRATAPLFDTDRYRRHLEWAYREMWDLHQRGEPPRPIVVPPVGS
ncbi:MAG TPA: tetratricopeptide repeat protein, partial [Stellaceae bacterium]|nr:tetratricopeptide repeat protein [Stellaceae bacterium]